MIMVTLLGLQYCDSDVVIYSAFEGKVFIVKHQRCKGKYAKFVVKTDMEGLLYRACKIPSSTIVSAHLNLYTEKKSFSLN